MDRKNVEYEQLPAKLAIFNGRNLLNECSRLYSNHYGRWSKDAPYAFGHKIKLSGDKIRSCWLDHRDANLYMARLGGELIGYAVAIRSKYKGYGIFSWVTQLVVHEDYRRQWIAKRLLFSIWARSNDFAWGLLTASPYAIRALEIDHSQLPEMIQSATSSRVPWVLGDLEEGWEWLAFTFRDQAPSRSGAIKNLNPNRP